MYLCIICEEKKLNENFMLIKFYFELYFFNLYVDIIFIICYKFVL